MKEFRSEEYREFIKKQNCAKCNAESRSDLDIVPHHEKLGGVSGGMSIKPSDLLTVPLCVFCHERRNALGRNTFWDELKPVKDLKLLIIRYLTQYMREQTDG